MFLADLQPAGARRRGILVSIAAACLASCADDAGPGPRPLVRPNLILVTIDTLRADHLGCYGYFRDTTPNIDALAKECVVFEQAFAVMATTLPSHTSMLTARYPLEHGILANIVHGGKPFGWKAGMISFAQVAKDAGYTTAGFVSAAVLKTQTGISAGFDTWSEPAADQSQRPAGETLADVLPWLERSAEQPFFLWVHCYDPHWPYRAPPPFDAQFRSSAADAELEAWITERQISATAVRTNGNKVTEAHKGINDYDAEVRYVDSEVGKLFDALRAKGVLDESVLVITADHGEGLNQHDWTAHGLVWEEQLRVPLLMRFPASSGIVPQRVTSLVSLIDLFPTVLAPVEPFDTPKWKQFFDLATGVDALSPRFSERPIFGQRTEREMADDPGEMYALTTRDWKFIHEPDVGDKLFDRRTDPHELHNVLERETSAAQRISKLTQLMRTDQEQRGVALGPNSEGAVDPELQKQLNELGYGGGDDGRSEFKPAPPKDAPDPDEPESSEPKRDAPAPKQP